MRRQTYRRIIFHTNIINNVEATIKINQNKKLKTEGYFMQNVTKKKKNT